MTSKSGGGGAKEYLPPKPVLNDRPAATDGEAERQAAAVRQDTGGAIDADAAHERSS